MAQPNLPKGIKIAFSNTPQAKDDAFAFNEIIEGNVQYLDVMGNDLGGNAKWLYALDDSINSGGTNGDLLQQDAVNAIGYSYLGARIWITTDGKVAYDASTLDLDTLGEGQHLTDTFTYAIRMANGAISWATATVDILGTNDGPVITSGPQSGSTKEDDVLSISGQVTATDIDAGDHQHYSGNASGVFGTFSVDASSGAWTYTLNNSAANVQALAEGETHDEVFTVTVTDDFGATATQDVTVHVTGTNDAPVITNGPQSGAVTEDAATNQATGHLTAVDIDHYATQSWSVVGGSASGIVDYEFRADSFKITRFGTDLLRDGFGNGGPPPSSPPFNPDTIQNPTSYITNGGFTESGGRLYLDSDNAVSFVSVGTPDPIVGQVAIARTNNDPSNTLAGLKQNAPFTIEGIFDLILPDSPREAYGIRATDRLIGGGGNPPDDLGDDTYDLMVRENIFGQDVVQLRHIDFVNDVTTLMGSFVISTPSGADQIRLMFEHTANSTDLQASFQYWSSLSNSQVGSTQYFSSLAPVFAADSVDTQSWIRGAVIAYAPLFTDSVLDGTYGTLNVNQAGNWTYALNNGRPTTQSLAQGQTESDTFDVTVTDDFGATDTTTVTVTVTGSNDAPVMQTAAVSRALTEDEASPDLTATGLAQFSDVDLTDTHTITAVLQSSSLSSGGSISAGLGALLANAMSASEVNASTGDGHGEVQWDFALANSEAQFLAEGETLVLVYNVNATDTFGATATQAVTVTITGTNDAPIAVAYPGDSAGTSWNETNAGLSATGTVTLLDPDTIDTVTSSVIVAAPDYGVRVFMLPPAVDLTTLLMPGAGLQDAELAAFGLSKADIVDYFDIAPTGNPLGTSYVHDGTPGTQTWTFNSQSQAFDFLAASETLVIYYFSVRPDDGHTIIPIGDAGIIFGIVGTNDAPLITGGVTGIGWIEDNADVVPALSATGGLEFSDLDLSDAHSVSSGLVSATWSGGATLPAGLAAALNTVFSASLGTDSTGSGDGTINWSFNSLDASLIEFLAKDETLEVVYNVTVSDGGASSTQPVTFTITGTNDVPVITNGPQSGAVTEDAAATQASGHLTVADPDHNATQSWTVVGGTPSGSADYHFRAESFTINKGSLVVLQDDFSDGAPPPSSPPFDPAGANTPTSYGFGGGFGEADGKLLLDSSNAISVVSVGTDDAIIGQFARVLTNINPASTLGLKPSQPFTISAVFDLILPDSPREVYGIRATDRLIGGPGNPPDQLGDDSYELVVRENIFGQDVIQLRHIDFQNDVVTNLQSFAIASPPGADQIRLVLDHAANSTFLQASFQYWSSSSNSAVGGIQTFGTTAPVFAADAFDTQSWLQTSIVAYAPLFTDSILDGTYGTLNINQAGNWTYTLNNALATTQSLAQGQTDTDTFDVTVADEFGATDTTTISVTVTGSNDTPVMQTAATSRSLTEDGSAPDLTATGLAQFSDVDLTDTHTISATLQSATLSSGDPLPGGLSALLNSAMSAQGVNTSTGDGHGEVQWDFALANSAIQFLEQGETLTLVYNVNAVDPFGATATQAVTVTVAGTNDAPDAVDDAITGAFGGGGAGGRIALEASGDNLSDTMPFVEALLEAQGYVVDIVQGVNIDTAVELSLYDAVLVGDSGHGDNDWNTFGVALKDYVENGGGFLASGWVPYFLSLSAGAGYDAMEDVLPVVSGTQYLFQPLIIPTVSHPITDGVSPWTTASYDNHGSTSGGVAKPGATVLALDSAGNVAVAIDDVGEGRVVHLAPNYLVSFHHYGQQSQLNGTNQNALKMFLNAVEWVSDGGNAATNEDTPLTIDQADLLANDSDPNSGDVLSIVSVSPTSALGAQVSIDLNGDVFYDPTAALQHLADGETVTDSFSYTISDGHGGFDTATVSLDVAGNNDAPVAEADKVVLIAENAATTSLNIAVPTDVDGDNLSATVTGLPAGTVGSVLLANNTPVVNGQVLTMTELAGLQFAPNVAGGGLSGAFSYTVSDGHGGTDSAAINIAVQDVVNTYVSATLTFDDLPGTYVAIPTGYGGFDWSSTNSSYYSLPDLWHGGYGNAGFGSQTAWTAYGGQYGFISWQGTDTVNIVGAYFANDSAAPNLRISGYNDGNLVAQHDVYGLSSAPTWVQLDFTGVDQLVVDSGLSGAPSRWWSMDNFTYSTGSVTNLTQTGGSGNDVLVGDGGTDRLAGGQGNDLLTGGAANDTFVFNSALEGTDTITDFVHGADIIEVSAAGFGGGLVANAAATVMTGADVASAVGMAAGSFFFDNTGPDQGTIYWDATGGVGNDAVSIARLQGVTSLLASDFQLV